MFFFCFFQFTFHWLFCIMLRPWRRGGKRTVLVSSSATAVVQHALAIRHLTDLNVAEYLEAQDTLDLKHNQVNNATYLS